MLTEVTNRLKGSGRWLVVPGGMRDVHVHFRDPGVPEAETRATGAQAAVVGGFTCVTTMPNTTPAGDNPEWLHEQIEDYKAGRLDKITVNEPSCGGGAMIIAAAKVLQEHEINYQKAMDVVAQDLDWKGVYMCYVQLSLLGISAICVQGDTLCDPYVEGKTKRSHIMRTPMKAGMLL